jgi:hypothetical protein
LERSLLPFFFNDLIDLSPFIRSLDQKFSSENGIFNCWDDDFQEIEDESCNEESSNVCDELVIAHLVSSIITEHIEI